jgi:hypothetical protein
MPSYSAFLRRVQLCGEILGVALAAMTSFGKNPVEIFKALD